LGAQRAPGGGDLGRAVAARRVGQNVLDDIIMSDGKVFRADLARSIRLFRAFRTEQTAPEAYYTGLAQDTILQLRQYTELGGRIVIDVGGGPGFFVRELNRMGARSFCVDADCGEMAALGPPEDGSLVASATLIPIASGAVDVCFSSNVLEHVRDWPAMLAEMVRVTRPGGIVFVAFTNWLSPYGGHETSPWHYLGGARAAARYERKHGTMPKNRFGHSLYPVSVAEVLDWARSAQDAVVVDTVPRYLPGWTWPLVRVPVLREFLTWNLLLVLRRELAAVGASATAPGGRPRALVRRIGGGFGSLAAGRRGHFGSGSFLGSGSFFGRGSFSGGSFGGGVLGPW
jgi:SAM-dependent methyltransferase